MSILRETQLSLSYLESIRQDIGRLFVSQFNVRNVEILNDQFDGKNVVARGGRQRENAKRGLTTDQLFNDFAVRVIALSPVSLVHHHQLDFLGGKKPPCSSRSTSPGGKKKHDDT